MTVDELVTSLRLELEAVRCRISYLETFDRVRENCDTVHWVE